jgi:hypothetical protein
MIVSFFFLGSFSADVMMGLVIERSNGMNNVIFFMFGLCVNRVNCRENINNNVAKGSLYVNMGGAIKLIGFKNVALAF